MKTKNIFLTASLTSLVIGFIHTGASIYWHMAFPVGAILFCLFMIFTLLEKESALLDAQRRGLDSAPAKPVHSAAKRSAFRSNDFAKRTTALNH